ncbi:MAG: sugar phosphate nucleotidyltransferase [Thermoplasmata archaeon]
MLKMEKVKTTINIDEELWKKFSHLVIEEKGYRKKNEVIENLIREYTEKKTKTDKEEINKAIILAAGMGTRLRPLTEDVCQCLLKINSETILEHQIKNLQECGIEDITIVTGYKSDKIREFCEENSWDVNFIHNNHYSKSNNLHTLWLARDHFDEGFVCLNSDVVFDSEILRSLLKAEGEVCLAVDKKECKEEDMKVKVEDGVTKISKRLKPEEVYGEFIGISKFSERGAKKLNRVLSEMPADLRKKGYVALGIQRLIDEGYKVFKVEIQRKFWKDIDFVEDFNEVRAQLSSRPSILNY